MRRSSGITLVEILVVLAILGILLRIGAVNLQGLRERSLVRQGAAEVSTVLLQAKGEAQRFNSNVIFTIGSGNTTYTLTRSGNTRTYTMPAGTFLAPAVSGGATTVTYLAPYGEVANTGASFCVSISAICTNATAKPFKVNLGVVGLTGKVVNYNP